MRGVWFLVASLAFSGTAWAAPSAQDRAIAEALFQEANKLAANNEIDAACKKFEASYALDPTLGTKLHSAACYEALGRTASAWAAYNEAASMAANAKDKRREKLARARIAKLEKGLPKLTIVVTEGVEGLRVRIDGHPLGAAGLGTAFPIDPGPHRISVSAPGHQTWSTSLTVARGSGADTLNVPELEKSAEKTATPAPQQAPPKDADAPGDGAQTQRTVGYVVGGAGIVALAAGSYFGLKARSQTKDADQHCDGKLCDPTGLAGHDDAHRSALVSTIGFGVGLAAIGAGAVLVLTAKPNSERAAWVVPFAREKGGGVFAGGRF
jgi:hypothetical protein